MGQAMHPQKQGVEAVLQIPDLWKMDMSEILFQKPSCINFNCEYTVGLMAGLQQC